MRFADFKPIDLKHVKRADMAPVHDFLDPHSPEIWCDLAEQAFLTLRADPAMKGINAVDLARCTVMMVYQFAHSLGGNSGMYIPMGTSLRKSRADRDKQICADFNGTNYRELARIHGLSEMRVRQIISPRVYNKPKAKP